MGLLTELSFIKLEACISFILFQVFKSRLATLDHSELLVHHGCHGTLRVTNCLYVLLFLRFFLRGDFFDGFLRLLFKTTAEYRVLGQSYRVCVVDIMFD